MFLLVFAAEHFQGPEASSLMSENRRLVGPSKTRWERPQIAAALEAAKEVYFDRVRQIAMTSWTKGRVTLVGNATACVSLLAGEGIGLRMTEAYVLAGEIARADGDYRCAFAGYEGRLGRFVEAKQKRRAASRAPLRRGQPWVSGFAIRRRDWWLFRACPDY